jgi:hypothetical protein
MYVRGGGRWLDFTTRTRSAGYGSWKTGFLMAGVGTAVVVVVIALGG